MAKRTIKSAAAKRSEGLLKPCPFCNGEARLRKHSKIKDCWYIQCKDCGIRTTYKVEIDEDIPDFFRRALIQNWNRRATDGKDD